MIERHADYFIHGRGRGHASRAGAALRALDAAGYQATVHAGGDALDLLDCAQLSRPLQLRQPLRPSATAPLRLVQRSLNDAWGYIQARPDIVVSDGDQAALLASRMIGIPSLAIGHDLVFSGKVGLPRLPAAALRYQRLNSAPVAAAQRWVAVHFLPAQSLDTGLTLARPERMGLQTEVETEDFMVSYFRDRCGKRVVEMFATLGVAMRWFGHEAKAGPRVESHAISTHEFQQSLERCRAVVGSAGSNLLAECVLLGKPVLALYRQGDSEQYLNALLVEHAGVGMACAFEALSSGVAQRFIDRVCSADFAVVDLQNALPPLSRAVHEAVVQLTRAAVDETAFA